MNRATNLIKTAIKTVARRSLAPASYERLTEQYTKVRHSLRELKSYYSWAEYQNRRHLRRLHNAHFGRRCFVIGNGPSLAQTDLSLLACEVTIGSNGLFLMFDKMGYVPTFYTVEDYLVAEDRAEEINRIRGTTKIFPRALAYCLLPDGDTIYINFPFDDFKGLPPFSKRFDKIVYHGGTVTYLSLQLAYYIGCREVYLVGVDHNYTVPPGIDLKKDATIISETADVNHFHPDYFGPGYRYHNPRLDRMERAYLAARQFCDRSGMRILNATPGSKLEVFPQVHFEDVVRKER